jgi:hypothetical protein
MNTRNRLTLALMLGGGLAFSGAVVAQGAGQPQQPPAAAPTVEVDDSQLNLFVEAQTEVIKISEKWNARMQEAESPEAAQEIRGQAHEEMVSAVEDAGLSVEEFNQIATAAQADPELQNRLRSMHQQ